MKHRIELKSRWTLVLWHIFLAALLMTLCRIVYYGYNYSYFSDIEFGELLRILVGGVRFDLAMIGYGLIGYLLLTIVGAYVPRDIESKRWYRGLKSLFYLVPMTFYLLINISDVGYYPYVLRRATSEIFSEFKGKSMAGFYKEFIVDYWQLTIVFILLFAILMAGYFMFYYKRREEEPRRKTVVLTLVTILVTIIAMRGTIYFGEHPLDEAIVEKYTSNYKHRPIVINTPYSLSVKGKLKYRKYHFLSDQDLSSFFVPKYQAAPLSENDSLYGSFKGRNVMIILMESMAREFIGGLNKEIKGFVSYTPFLDSLLQKSLYAKYGYANGKRSVESFPAVFCSLPTFGGTFNEDNWQMVHYQHFNSISTGMPKSMKAHQYDMSFYHGDKPYALGFMSFLERFGMEKQYTYREYNNPSDYDGKWAIYDAPFLQGVAKDMDHLKSPFLSIFFSATNHAPFNLPSGFEERFKGGSLPIHATVQYADYAIGQFFESIKDKPWYDDTLFVLVADHTNLTDHPDYDCVQGHSVIPIIFYDPRGQLKGEISDYVVQQADIYPTLMYLLGDDTPILSYGHNMLNPQEEHYALNFLFDNYILFHKDVTIEIDVDGNVRTSKPAPYLQTEPGKDVEPSQAIRAKYTHIMEAIVQDYNNRVLSNGFTLSKTELESE